jgi:hypothetical protein
VDRADRRHPQFVCADGGRNKPGHLLARDPAEHVVLDRIGGVACLLDALREAGAQDQLTLLIDRLTGEGSFNLFCTQGNNRALYRFGCDPDGIPARSWGWDDLN